MSNIQPSHEMVLLDFTFHAHEITSYVERMTAGFTPDIVGISANSFTVRDGFKIAALIKSRYKEAKIFWGGLHPTLFPEEMIGNPLVDGLCLGDGEVPFREVLSCLENGKPLKVENVWHKFDGYVQRNPLCSVYPALDAYPFPGWDRWEIDSYLSSSQFFFGSLAHMSSRGCPQGCTFCSMPALRRKLPGAVYRSRDPDGVADEIQKNFNKYRSSGMRAVSFLDSIFGRDKEWLKSFCAGYRQRGLHQQVLWHCQTRADLLDEESAGLMKGAGCMLVDLGIESGNEHMRNSIYKKGVTDKQAYQAIRILRYHKMPFRVNMIVGHPYESVRMIGQSIQWTRRMRPVSSRFTFYQSLPGTELSKQDRRPAGYDEKGILNAWDYPRCSGGMMRYAVLTGIMWILRIGKFMRAVCYGVSAHGPLLPAVLTRYFKSNRIPLSHPYAYLNVIDFLEQEYIWRRSCAETIRQNVR